MSVPKLLHVQEIVGYEPQHSLWASLEKICLEWSQVAMVQRRMIPVKWHHKTYPEPPPVVSGAFMLGNLNFGAETIEHCLLTLRCGKTVMIYCDYDKLMPAFLASRGGE